MEYYTNFLSSPLKQTPDEYYRQNRQALVDELWLETDRIRPVLEQQAYPFTDIYTEHKAWVCDVSENSIATQKNISDFIEIWYQDENYKQNYKGQYYKIDNEIYICYDKVNPFSDFYNFKCVRANNELTLIDPNNGQIKHYPCYIGTEIRSTQNSYSKTGVTESVRVIMYTQANEQTLKLRENDRFIVSHNHAFKIEQIDNYINEYGVKTPTYVKVYLAYEPILPEDNLALNIANYDNYKYTVKIDHNKPIKATLNESGTLVGSVYLNGNITELHTNWTTSNAEVVTITENGIYNVISSGNATITCSFADNTEIFDTIEIEVVEQHENEYSISLNVSDNTTIYNGDILDIDVKCFENGAIQNNADFTVTPNWENNSKYLLRRNDNIVSIENIEQSRKPLQLTFEYKNVQKTINIKLGGGF